MGSVRGKIAFRCPHCGFVQQEPPKLISTYCRGCGAHYATIPERAALRTRDSVMTRAARVVRKAIDRPDREILCYQCGTTHIVSGYAQSTLCPTCSTSIFLQDLVVDSTITRPIDIRGFLHVTATGSLQNASTVCGEGLIEGRISGSVFCEGELRLANRGRCFCSLAAQRILIERDADLAVNRPIRAGEAIIRGHLAARIVCSGRISIQKHASLEGDVQARGFEVNKGGIYRGNMTIKRIEFQRPGDLLREGWIPDTFRNSPLEIPASILA